jgi:hypothetical protein
MKESRNVGSYSLRIGKLKQRSRLCLLHLRTWRCRRRGEVFFVCHRGPVFGALRDSRSALRREASQAPETAMQDLLGGMDNAGSKSRDNELAKVMFEGSTQYRKKLKLPEMNAHAEKIKSEVSPCPGSKLDAPWQQQVLGWDSYAAGIAAGMSQWCKLNRNLLPECPRHTL